MLSLLILEVAEGNYKRMAIALPNGDRMTSDGLTYNIAERPYFQEAITGKAAVSDTIDDYTDHADQCLCRAGFSARSGGRSGGGIGRNREDEKNIWKSAVFPIRVILPLLRPMGMPW